MNPSAYSDLRELVTFRPLDRPLTSLGLDSPFKAGWTSTVKILTTELDHLRPERALMLVDLREQDFRVDGIPRADRRARTPGIVLSMFSRRLRHDLRYEVATYTTWEDNVRALALSLEALRKVDRYRVTKSGEQYAGWKQLTAGAADSFANTATARQYLVELVTVDGAADADVVEHDPSLYKAALRRAHPDRGGSDETFRRAMAAGQTLGVA